MDTDNDFQNNFYDEASGSGLATEKFQLLRRIVILEAPSAATTITDGASGDTVIIIPASAAIGTIYDLGDVRCPNGVYFNDNSHSAGQFNFIAKKYIKGA